MNTAQLEGLFRTGFTAIGMPHEPAAIEQFVFYLQEVMKWNERTNLTGHKSEEDIIGNLFIDSLACTKVLLPDTTSSVLDIGTGAGFPGIPMGIVCPQQAITLVEPNLKKVAFLHHIIGSLSLTNVCVEPCRIEQFSEKPEFHEKFDWVFMKALRFDLGLAYVTPLLSECGKCVFCRAEPLTPDLVPKGFSVVDELPYELPFGLGNRLLSIVGHV
ncbi:MAG: 16S rRNA (guanine(527)-N(7))-methyltransferase RsmG [Nitrospira sp. SB0678_bin_10]|nr:16S rRNA (guanine(527)-N(7))-methyltransferase RsmG [Nitrospira sp. SB0678_bin_10]